MMCLQSRYLTEKPSFFVYQEGHLRPVFKGKNGLFDQHNGLFGPKVLVYTRKPLFGPYTVHCHLISTNVSTVIYRRTDIGYNLFSFSDQG